MGGLGLDFYKFSREELSFLRDENTAVKLIGFLQVSQKAIDIINKYIEKIEKSDDETLKDMILEDLKHGLSVLEKGKSRDIRNGVKEIEKDLKRFKRGNRPGFGLHRGFCEFLGGSINEYKNWKGEWSDEILNAVIKIDAYYNYM
jgi:hypothetical protein